MPQQIKNTAPPTWVEGELRLVGMLDRRMISLLQAIDQCGSINQAAKQVGLSYKGAWQIIERANNRAPKVLISTATGGNKGGGTYLTDAGRQLVQLFLRVQEQHQKFLDQLNQTLHSDPDTHLLLQRLIVKTSARNQLFGKIVDIRLGAVNAEVTVKLKGGEQAVISVSLNQIESMGLATEADALLLINYADIVLTTEESHSRFVAANRLPCRVLRIHEDQVNSEIWVTLSGGEILTVSATPFSIRKMGIEPGQSLWAIFSSNAPILGTSR